MWRGDPEVQLIPDETQTVPAVTPRPRIFYGWRIAAAGAGLQFMNAAFLVHAFGAYVAVISEQLGWSKTALAGGAAVLAVEGAIIGPVLGWMIDRMGPRIMVQWGVVLAALGFFAFSQVDSLAGFYAAVAIIAVGSSLSSYFPLSVALVHFFRRHRAKALSVMSLGLAAGGLAMPLLGWALETIGWRYTAVASGVLTLLVGWPLAGIIRRDPSEVSETVDGLPPVEDKPGRTPVVDRDFTAAEALRTRAFWLLGLGHGMALLVVSAVNVHAISHMKEGLGYSLPTAAFFVTLMTVGQGVGILLGAAVGDRWNKRFVASGCMVAHAAGLLMLTFAVHPAMLVAFATLHGVAWGLRGPFMQAIRADYFGLRAIGMILGLSAIIVAAGQITGPMLAGVLADMTGNYRVGFVTLALVAACGSAMFLLARKPA